MTFSPQVFSEPLALLQILVNQVENEVIRCFHGSFLLMGEVDKLRSAMDKAYAELNWDARWHGQEDLSGVF